MKSPNRETVSTDMQNPPDTGLCYYCCRDRPITKRAEKVTTVKDATEGPTGESEK